MKINSHASRNLAQLRKHYEIEKELADKLRNATPLERHTLYTSLYNELYLRVPDHPQLLRKQAPKKTDKAVRLQMTFLQPFLSREVNFLEVGPGDCALSYEVAKQVKQVYAVDVSDEITRAENTPNNFQLVLSDGCSIPVPLGSINVAYSNDLMEHLHPDDAFEQLHNIYLTLAPGGVYVCATPNRLTGPHDVSKHFDRIATGFHLKEYTLSELNTLFTQAGFSKMKVFAGGLGFYLEFYSLVWIEKVLTSSPTRLSYLVFHSFPFNLIFLYCRVLWV